MILARAQSAGRYPTLCHRPHRQPFSRGVHGRSSACETRMSIYAGRQTQFLMSDMAILRQLSSWGPAISIAFIDLPVSPT